MAFYTQCPNCGQSKKGTTVYECQGCKKLHCTKCVNDGSHKCRGSADKHKGTIK